MNRENSDLSLFNNSFDLSPKGFFRGLFNENFLDEMSFGGFKVDVKEKKNAYIIDAEMPGFDKKDINIEIDDNLLTISASLDESNEQKDDGGRYIRRERRTGSFRRSFPLSNIKSDEIKAQMKNGILTIYCPKKSETLPRSKNIEIE